MKNINLFLCINLEYNISQNENNKQLTEKGSALNLFYVLTTKIFE